MPDTTKNLPLRRCLALPIPAFDMGADLLGDAVDAMLAGEEGRASQLLAAANLTELRAFGRRVMGSLDPEIHQLRQGIRTSSGTKVQDRMPSAVVEAMILKRDGHRCRFCGCRVVRKQVRQRLRKLFPDAVPMGDGTTYHAAFYVLTASIDHVVPHAHGGDSAPENLVTTCRPCNFGRGAYSLAAMGLIDPRLHAPVVDDWDGLARAEARGKRWLVAVSDPERERTVKGGLGDIVGTEVPMDQAWHAEIEHIYPGAAAALKDFLAPLLCQGIGVAGKKTLQVVVLGEGRRFNAIGILPNGDVEVPWLVYGNKALCKQFSMRVAEAIAGAESYETPTMWPIRVDGVRRINVRELLAAGDAVRVALCELHEALSQKH